MKDRPSREFKSAQSPDTDELPISQESGLTQTFQSATREHDHEALEGGDSEADIILIAHPDSQRLGTRYRLSPGTTLEVGRSSSVRISLPEVMSLSRKHARLRYTGSTVTIEAEGADADQALAALLQLIADKFGEGE